MRLRFEYRPQQQPGDSQLDQVVEPIDQPWQTMNDTVRRQIRRRLGRFGLQEAKWVEMVPHVAVVHRIGLPVERAGCWFDGVTGVGLPPSWSTPWGSIPEQVPLGHPPKSGDFGYRNVAVPDAMYFRQAARQTTYQSLATSATAGGLVVVTTVVMGQGMNRRL